MLRKILKFSLAAILITGALKASAAKAADTAFTLHAVDDDYSINAATLNLWQTPVSKNGSYIAFEPIQNNDDYMLNALGLKSQAKAYTAFNKYNVGEIYKFLRNKELKINRDPENAIFKMQDGTATDFNPGANGRDLDIKNSVDAIIAALLNHHNEANLAINQTAPETKLADTNQMGIKELIAVGDSNFSGSPSNRIFNIHAGVGKEAGTIIAPGETFSFNKFLGPVDAEHGFLPELVIKKEGTVPEFGGGLCQVSTTTFRAAMNAGFPITARRNHSYAVQYYAPQGTDATIYPGVQDLKFVNDSPGHILIWPTFPGRNKLRFAIYGTKDSRQVAFDGPYQFDRKPDGSLKAVWYRTITLADGTIKKDTFNSYYQSPALFHKVEAYPKDLGNAPVPAATARSNNQTPISSQ